MHTLQPAIDYVNRRIIEWQAIVMNLVAMRDGYPLAEIPASLPDRSPLEIAPTPPQEREKSKVKRTYIKRGPAREDARPTEEKPKRKYTRRAASVPATAQSESRLLEKPATIGGAMKFVARQLKTFTRAQLVEALEADKDFAKIMTEASPPAMGFNLKYWSTHGKIEKSGEGDEATYTVIDVDF